MTTEEKIIYSFILNCSIDDLMNIQNNLIDLSKSPEEANTDLLEIIREIRGGSR